MTEELLDETEQGYAEWIRNLGESLKIVWAKIKEAVVKPGRNSEEITLLATAKMVPVPMINCAIELGVSHISENRMQKLCDKLPLLSPCDRQFTGHPQTNKVKSLIGQVSLIQSMDNEKFVEEIPRLSLQNKTTTGMLIEANIGREENKSGVLPGKLSELPEKASCIPDISVRGLMVIPPIYDRPEDAMPYFSRMHEYCVDTKTKRMDNILMDYLSMGISSDYAQAILCGANMIWMGSSFFGPRKYQIPQNENREASEWPDWFRNSKTCWASLKTSMRTRSM